MDGLEALEELRQRYFTQVQLKNQMKAAMRDKFRNISRIMDCVTCEKCRLWGKLQFLGVGTALKVSNKPSPFRNEPPPLASSPLFPTDCICRANHTH